MKISKCIKTAAVFIGTLIGAGFATGREIVLFFGSSHPIVPIMSAAVCAVFAALFLIAGRNSLNVVPEKGGKFILCAFFLAAMIVYSAMISAAEDVIRLETDIIGGGVMSAAVTGAVCLFIPGGLKYLNLLVVPAIIIFAAILSSHLYMPALPSSFPIQNAVAYAALNIFLGGFLIVPDGREMNGKEIALTGVVCFVCLSFLMLMIYKIALNAPEETMPSIVAAERAGMRFIASAIIYCAVITTMGGCFTALAAIGNTVIKNRWASAAGVAALGMIIAVAGFRFIVDYGYPVVSVAGILYSVGVVAAVLKGRKKAGTLPYSN